MNCTKAQKVVFGVSIWGVVFAVATVLFLWPLVSLKYALFGAAVGMAFGIKFSIMWRKNQLQRALFKQGFFAGLLHFKNLPKHWQQRWM